MFAVSPGEDTGYDHRPLALGEAMIARFFAGTTAQ